MPSLLMRDMEAKRLRDENPRLREINAELLGALETALECIRYCRRTHPDPQKGDGIPVDIFISEAIAKARQ